MNRLLIVILSLGMWLICVLCEASGMDALRNVTAILAIFSTCAAIGALSR